MVTTLTVLAKMAALGLLQRKAFWNRSYDVMTFHDSTNKILSLVTLAFHFILYVVIMVQVQ